MSFVINPTVFNRYSIVFKKLLFFFSLVKDCMVRKQGKADMKCPVPWKETVKKRVMLLQSMEGFIHELCTSFLSYSEWHTQLCVVCWTTQLVYSFWKSSKKYTEWFWTNILIANIVRKWNWQYLLYDTSPTLQSTAFIPHWSYILLIIKYIRYYAVCYS